MNDHVQPEETVSDKAVSALFIAFGTTLVTVVTDPPDGLFGWILMIIGALIIGVFGAGLLGIVRPWIVKLLKALKEPFRRIGTIVVILALASGLIWVAAPWVSWGVNKVLVPCPPPAQVSALTTPDLLVPYRNLANQYEDVAADRDGDCRPAEIHVSAMPAARTIEGIRSEWSAEYLREAPRPDIWLAEAKTHVDVVRTSVQTTEFGPRMEITESIGTTPIVLAVPASSGIDPKSAEWSGQTWASLVGKLQAAGIPLVRPGTSTVSEFSTVAIYNSAGGAVQLRSNPGPARALESWIDSSLKAGGYPSAGDGSALLRRQRELGTAGAAMVISEQDVIRYNQDVRRAARGRGCDAHNGPPECVLAVYPVDTHPFDLPVVLLNWAGNERSERQRTVAAQFRTWLSTEGQPELVGQRLRPLPGTPLHDPLSEENGILQGGPTANATGKLTSPAVAVRDEMISIQQTVRKTGSVLISLDASGSMRERVGAETRYQLAVKAIKDAHVSLAKHATVSLNVFSATMGVRQVDLDSIGQVQPAGNTPQHRAILDGMRTAGQGGVLVLVTDGNNNVNDVSPQQLAEQSGVRVLVLAFGEATCGTQVLIDVTNRTGGSCRQAAVDTLSTDLADLLRAGGLQQ